MLQPTAGLSKKLMQKINTHALDDTSGKEPAGNGNVQFCSFTL
jgi:uncharacterized protein YjcR